MPYASAALAAMMAVLAAAPHARAQNAPPIWTVPEIGALPNDAKGNLVRRGRDLVTATYARIGSEVADPAKRLPATISPAATAICRPAPRSSAFRCSGSTA